METATNTQEFLADLEAGVFEQKLGKILSDVAAAVVDNDRKGKVTVDFTLERIGNSYQVQVNHKLSYAKPTLHGKSSEESTTSTPMYVGTGGRLTLFPEGQEQLFTKTGEVQE